MHDESSDKPTEGIIDYNTGIVYDVPSNRRAITVAKKERLHGKDKTIGINGGFVKILNSAYSVMSSITLTKSEQKILSLIIPLAQFYNQECRHKNKKVVTGEWLARETGMSRDTVLRALKALDGHGFISQQDGKIILNPYFSPRGKSINAKVAWLFINTEFAKSTEEEK